MAPGAPLCIDMGQAVRGPLQMKFQIKNSFRIWFVDWSPRTPSPNGTPNATRLLEQFELSKTQNLCSIFKNRSNVFRAAA